MRCSAAARAKAVCAAHPGKASAAAATAAWASERSPCGIAPMTSPVTGLVASKVSPEALGLQAPPTNISWTVAGDDSAVDMRPPRVVVGA